MNTSTIVQKLWNYCNVLRDDGMSYGDYVEAAPAHPCARGIRTSLFSTLTYLLFLKMANERSKPPYNQASPVLAGYDWLPSPRPSPRGRGRLACDGDDLFDHYRHTLEELGKQNGLLGLIFTKSQNKFDSAHP
jgi:type I restriction enzyme M protein